MMSLVSRAFGRSCARARRRVGLDGAISRGMSSKGETSGHARAGRSVARTKITKSAWKGDYLAANLFGRTKWRKAAHSAIHAAPARSIASYPAWEEP